MRRVVTSARSVHAVGAGERWVHDDEAGDGGEGASDSSQAGPVRWAGPYRPPQVAVAAGANGKFTSRTLSPFSCCVAVGLDVVQNEDGLDDRGCSAWTAT